MLELKKMKIFLASLVLCLLWSAPLVAQTESDLEREKLLGPVKSVEIFNIDRGSTDSATARRRPLRRTTYNANGNVLELISYDQNGDIQARHVYSYDANGRSTGYEEYSAILDKKLSTPRRHVYKLDKEGRRVEYLVLDSNESVSSRSVHKYDAKGNKIEDQWYTYTGELSAKMVYTFDEKGRQISQAAYEGDSVLTWKNFWKYDVNGNKTESMQYEGEILRYKVIYSFNVKGKILEEETFEFNRPPNSFTTHAPEPGKKIYTYDEEKRTLEVTTYAIDGSLKRRFVHVYDEQGNEIGATTFNGDAFQHRTSIEVEYDSHGNWTKKTQLMQSEAEAPLRAYSTQARVITYY